MVDLSISGSNLVLHVRGADKLWAFKSSLPIPLTHIAEIRADSAMAQGWWHGLRMPGTNISGVLTARTFYQDGKRIFWDVHNPDKYGRDRTEGRTVQRANRRSRRPESCGGTGQDRIAALKGVRFALSQSNRRSARPHPATLPRLSPHRDW